MSMSSQSDHSEILASLQRREEGDAQMTSQTRVRALENDFGIRVIPIFFLVFILIIVATAATEGGM